MKSFFEVLEYLYKKVFFGVIFENDIYDYIFYLNFVFLD